MNTTRISNFFAEIRVVSYSESLALQGFPLFINNPDASWNIKIAKMFSNANIAIWTRLFDIITLICCFKRLRCLVFQRLMWANLIVKTDIFIHALSKVPFRSIFAPVGFLFFECGKECLCDRIIERRAACGKGLLNAILLQKFTKCSCTIKK